MEDRNTLKCEPLSHTPLPVPDGVRAEDVIESYNAEVHLRGTFSLSYSVREFNPPADGTDVKYPTEYQASTPYRSVIYIATTREAAIASMLFDVAKLARDGSFNPATPFATGSSPIQHALEVLQERLTWHLKQRKDCTDEYRDAREFTTEVYAVEKFSKNTAPHNEAIISLGTAIAALARVKDL